MASVLLGDLDDFIAPGQACINPLFTTAADSAPATAAAAESAGSKGGAAMVLEIEDDGGPLDAMAAEEVVKPDLIRASNTQTAKVSLDDCLACSGCVTSAETVLITQQSTGKLREAVASGRRENREFVCVLCNPNMLCRRSLHLSMCTLFFAPKGVTQEEARLGAFPWLCRAREQETTSLRHSQIAAAGMTCMARDDCMPPSAVDSSKWLRPTPSYVHLPMKPSFVVACATFGKAGVLPGPREKPSCWGCRYCGGCGEGERSKKERLYLPRHEVHARSIRAPFLSPRCRLATCGAETSCSLLILCLVMQLCSSQMMGVLAKRVFPRAWNQPYPSVATAAAVTAAAAADEVSRVRDSASNGATASTLANETLDQSTPPPVRPRGVFHVSIAQCYDKKLEASRKDFRHQDLDGDAEVDLVLTTAEVLELIEESASAADATLASTSPASPSRDAAGDYFRRHCPPGDLAEPLAPGFPVGQAAVSVDGLSLFGGVDGEGAAGGNSGGYLEYVFRHAAVELFGVDLAGRPLVYREGRNADFRETSLEVNGQVVLRFAYAYGFRNIQSILAKARRGKCTYHFVEVMACPSGCVNGGGQIKPKKKEGPRDTRQRVERVSEVLREGRVPRGPHDNPVVQAVYSELVGGGPGESRARELLHTSYHNVPKLELSNPHMSPW
ncbi:unnamed protein product [Ectocarpus sp. 8 AP-2014]